MMTCGRNGSVKSRNVHEGVAIKKPWPIHDYLQKFRYISGKMIPSSESSKDKNLQRNFILML